MRSVSTTSQTGGTAERFVEATLELIAERGGSQDVNLRQIARRVGCAHTNAYNYFSSYDDLLWAAFRRGLRLYGEYLVHDLDDTIAPQEYLARLVTNLASYPEENQGLYRFIGSDPIDLETIPPDILVSVSRMKEWLFDVLEATYAPDLHPEEAMRISNIVLAYIDGETLNLINGRVVPGEDVRGRVVDNAMGLIRTLSGRDPLAVGPSRGSGGFPTLDLSEVEGGN
jgi:AcrR family transcriptional regulator